MAIKDALEELKGFDVNDLDLENIGSWPMAVKVIVWAMVFVGVLFGGYNYGVSELQDKLAEVEKEEKTLKQQYEIKAFQAANLEGYRHQMLEMEESFKALVSQLPSDTEVPGLLEDITGSGVENGLEITSIDLQPESAQEFHIELPIQIEVKGSYHDMGAFVSGISALPRIVTLHDFEVEKLEDESVLTMKITAKTYRYKDVDEEGGDV